MSKQKNNKAVDSEKVKDYEIKFQWI